MRRYAEAARVRGGFDEAVATFWKERPFFREILGMVTATEVTLVPFFTSAGYYCRTVLPREMKLSGAVTTDGRRTIRCTAPLGEHPGMAALIRRRVSEAVRRHSLEPQQTCAVLVGHGTQRDPRSAELTWRHAEFLRRDGVVDEVVAVFLDQPPELETAPSLTPLRNLIIVPYLIGRADHELHDIPRRLGMQVEPGVPVRSPQEVGERNLLYTSAIGDDSAIVEMILDLATAVRNSSPRGCTNVAGGAAPGMRTRPVASDPEGVVSARRARRTRRPL